MKEFKRMSKKMIDELKCYKYIYLRDLYIDDHKDGMKDSFEIDGENVWRLGDTKVESFIFSRISMELSNSWFRYIYVSNDENTEKMTFKILYYKKPTWSYRELNIKFGENS